MPAIRQTQGLAALYHLFQTTAAQNRAAFMPYWAIGYPDYDTSLEILTALSAIGADGFEIGIPFSDPIADGVMVQTATQIALENGITVKKCLEAIQTLRSRGLTQPMMIMGYLNPLLAYGAEKLVMDAKAAGADGFIIPDLPPEEAHYFAAYCQRENMAQVFFLAPTSNQYRIELVSKNATGFIYTVAQVGVTGARDTLSEELPEFIARVRQQTNTPLVLGFGISKPEHARAVNHMVNGFIVASALLQEHHHNNKEAAIALAKAIRAAIE